MNTEELVLEVKKALRSQMNGVLSAQMRTAGMPYRLVFGVQLPALQQIAAEFPADRALAQALWNQPIRECRILACMLMPLPEFTAQLADIWAEEIPSAEIAQIFSMYLLSRMDGAAGIAFEWIATEDTHRQLCGFLSLARLLQQGAQLQERSLQELTDQSHALLPHADLHLRKAIQAVLAKI